VTERAARAFAAGADGVIASPHEAALIRALPEARGQTDRHPRCPARGQRLQATRNASRPRREAIANGADHIVVGRPVWQAPIPPPPPAIRRNALKPEAERVKDHRPPQAAKGVLDASLGGTLEKAP
jgi:orotidine-5'-phosphate decarboxylase